MLLLLCALAACRPPGQKADGSPDFTPTERTQIFALSPLPAPPENPGNRYADDPAAAHFGQYLFFDPRLSKNNKVNCASCHNPGFGWSDTRQVAHGIGDGTRNSMSLWNVAYQRWFFWDGRADSLWSQSLGPLQSAHEMGASQALLHERFRQNKDLKAGYEAVFGPLPEAPDNVFLANIGKALEAYERQIISGEAPFDRFAKALHEGAPEAEQHLSVEARKGLRLFVGAGRCILCHQGTNFSDGEFHNLGLTVNEKTIAPEDPGRLEGVRILQQSPFNGKGSYSDMPAEHPQNDKLNYLKPQQSQLGAFRTPGLREVSKTAPYMHDGRFGTLDEVLAFYNAPVGEPSIGEREDTLQPLNLKPEELGQLKAFLESLTSGPPDKALIVQPKSSVFGQ